MEYIEEKYYLLKFYRKALHGAGKDCDRDVLLTMDYFDALKVQSFNREEDHLRRFMGLNVSEELTENDTAMQSIPVYRPEMKKNEYFCTNDYYGDPLYMEGAEQEGYYLGIIQVYITPEMMARFMCEEQNKGENNLSGLDIYDIYYRDLHALLAKYVSSLDESVNFTYSIYKSLAVGDFVVAIRCWQPDIPFRIAALIRRRKIHLDLCDKTNPKAPHENLVLYKTYTSLCMNSHVLQSEEMIKSESNEAGYFVLRCILSNKYWSDESTRGVEGNYDLNVFVNSPICLRLNGRYDFTAMLSMEAFSSMFPVLMEHKLDLPSGVEIHYRGSEAEKAFCELLYKLIDNDYISHINERFVFNCTVPEEGDFYHKLESMEKEAGFSICLTGSEQRFQYLNTIIAKKIQALKNRIKENYHRVLKLDFSKRSLVYSVRLIEKLANNCSSINGSSDSRVYASMIIDQINAVLDGLEEYCEYLKLDMDCCEEDYDTALDKIDDSLKRSVEYINSFSRFVLDSSLQSLQTPHYNLETHVSAEKLLMAYSSFMRQLLDWYGKNAIKDIIDIGTTSYQFLPVMVPQQLNASLVTELPFSWSSSYVSDKQSYHEMVENSHNFNRRLLFVLCPSFSDLTDFAGVIGNLFHETAHYLRYETRKERNKVILKYSESLLFTLAARSIVKEIERTMGLLQNRYSVVLLFQDIFADAYHEAVVLTHPDFEEIADLRYIRLIASIEECYKKFIKAFDIIMELRAAVDSFITEDIEQDNTAQIYNDCLKEAIKLKALLNAPSNEWEKEYKTHLCTLFTFLDNTEEKSQAAHNLYYFLDSIVGYFNRKPKEVTDELVRTHRTVVMFCVELNNKFVTQMSEKTEKNQQESKIVNRTLHKSDKKKLRRLLGLESYKTRYRADYFADFAAIYILPHEATAFTYFKQMVDIYCEASSDLFMVEMLGLTEYGYLNYCSKYMPISGHMNETYIKRLSMVLYALQNGQLCGAQMLGKEKLSNMWTDIFRSISDHIHSFCIYYGTEVASGIKVRYDNDSVTLKDILVRLSRMAKELVIQVENRELSFLDIEMAIVDYIQIFGEILADFEVIQYSIENERYERTITLELRRCQYLCSNYLQLMYEYEKVNSDLRQFEYIANDLIAGDRNLKVLNKLFVKDLGIWKYCKMVRDCFNQSGLSQFSFLEQNTCMTSFVLDMHYKLMFESAVECITQ